MLAPIDFSKLKVGDTLYQFEKITDHDFITKQNTVSFHITPVKVSKVTSTRIYTDDKHVYKYRKTMFLPDANDDKYFLPTTTEIRLYPSAAHAQAAIAEWYRLTILWVDDEIKALEYTANKQLRKIEDDMKQQPTITQESTNELVNLSQKLSNMLNMLR